MTSKHPERSVPAALARLEGEDEPNKDGKDGEATETEEELVE